MVRRPVGVEGRSARDSELHTGACLEERARLKAKRRAILEPDGGPVALQQGAVDGQRVSVTDGAKATATVLDAQRRTRRDGAVQLALAPADVAGQCARGV